MLKKNVLYTNTNGRESQIDNSIITIWNIDTDADKQKKVWTHLQMLFF